MDNLEKFIKEHRKDLDILEPSPRVWNTIERAGGNDHKRPLVKWYAVAASIIVITGLTLVFMQFGQDERHDSLGSWERRGLYRTNPELRETEIYYNDRVSSLFNQAAPMLTSRPELEKELLHDLSKLDSICSDIKEDLRDNVSNSEVIEALINNYRIRIMILEEMVEVLKNEELSNLKEPEDAI